LKRSRLSPTLCFLSTPDALALAALEEFELWRRSCSSLRSGLHDIVSRMCPFVHIIVNPFDSWFGWSNSQLSKSVL
jgi:hypothetical protein